MDLTDLRATALLSGFDPDDVIVGSKGEAITRLMHKAKLDHRLGLKGLRQTILTYWPHITMNC